MQSCVIMDVVIEKTISLDARAVNAKQSTDEMERLIEDFKPFLHARVSKYSYCIDAYRHEDVFSVAMMAFYEAVQSYDADKGHFFPFVNRVVCNRIVDCIRKEYISERTQTVPLENDGRDEQFGQSATINKISIHTYERASKHELLVEEIEQFKAELSTWEITMADLVKHSPKHQKLREAYREVVSIVLQNPDIIQTIQLKRYFPVKAVAEITKLPLKKLERARTFIIASLIIKMGDYDYLSDYVTIGGS